MSSFNDPQMMWDRFNKQVDIMDQEERLTWPHYLAHALFVWPSYRIQRPMKSESELDELRYYGLFEVLLNGFVLGEYLH